MYGTLRRQGRGARRTAVHSAPILVESSSALVSYRSFAAHILDWGCHRGRQPQLSVWAEAKLSEPVESRRCLVSAAVAAVAAAAAAFAAVSDLWLEPRT